MKRALTVLFSAGLGLVLLYQITAVLSHDRPQTVYSASTIPNMKITDLGTLGGMTSRAIGIGNNGEIAGNSVLMPPSQRPQAFRWSGNEMIPLSSGEGLTTEANAINNYGAVAGALTLDDGQSEKAFPALWKENQFKPLLTIGGKQGSARAVNDLGVVSGQTNFEPNNELLIWENEVLTQIVPINDGLVSVNAMNNQGQIVGHIQTASKKRAFLWQNAGFTDLGTLGGKEITAHDINEAGIVVGEASITGELAIRAFVWNDSEMIDLGVPSEGVTATSRALGINNLGIIVGEAQIGDELHAVKWDGDQLIDLNMYLPQDSEWDVLISAAGINDEGWIAGTGIVAGNEHAFLLRPAEDGHESFLPYVAGAKQGPLPTATPTITPTMGPSPTPTDTPTPTLTPSATPTSSPTPEGAVYDMANFMIGDGRLYEVRFSDGSQARHQTQKEGIRFWHTKGNEISAEWEELWADDNYIYRGTDTSPGDGEYYTQYENSKKGAKWSPRYWRVGDVYERNPFVIFFKKSDCRFVEGGSALSWLRFEEHYDRFLFPSGITLRNVVKLAWLIPNQVAPEEYYYYAQNYGLVGWSSSSRGFSNISEIHQPGTRPDNKRETILCLNESLSQSLDYAPELIYRPLPEAFALRVK